MYINIIGIYLEKCLGTFETPSGEISIYRDMVHSNICKHNVHTD